MNWLKTVLHFIGILASVYSFAQPVNFTLKGKLTNKTTATKVYLQGDINEEVLLTNEKSFVYTGSLPKSGLLLVKTDNSYAWGIWITDGTIDVTLEEWYSEGMDSAGKKLLKVTGISGPAETEKNQWFINYINQLNQRYPLMPTAQRKDSVDFYFYKALEEYVTAHPSSNLATHAINFYRLDVDKKNKLLSLLNREVNSDERKKIEKAIAQENLLKAGNKISGFTQPTINGTQFSSASLQSKYTLLEFWASDCAPCRSSHPGLIETYNKFKNKGFEIVGISLDDAKNEWKKAVKKDKLPWIQVSDLKGWDNTLAVKYLVTFIPFNILIDKDKNIVATNLMGKALEEKLATLLPD
ncbi:MAG TPA: TlpA disulfide reductase family protein [Chitinophagaceae bacterium]|nr:TlpA disulfide reductase family protein [Chitinophagaceae bacterium]